MAETAAERIIWSADVAHEDDVMKHLDLMPELRRIKIDRLFTERRHRFVLGVLKDRGLDVFYDAKFIEIPSKLEELAKVAVQHEPWMLNCMAGSLSSGVFEHDDKDQIDGLKRFADVCLNADVLPCAVTVLTSKTEGMVWKEFNGRHPNEQVIFYASVLVECGFTDLVCSPLEARALLMEGFDDIRLNTPGIRFADSSAGDQARTNTPGGAISSGVARVVMGRDLTKGDPAANFARAVAEIDDSLAA
jgi:orotidine-5'-phosphate decarboxylase